jgi:hypothetical protein
MTVSAKQSVSPRKERMDCFVASLLAMTTPAADQAQFRLTGWKPLAFRTAAAEGDDMKLMSALAASGALLVVMIPAAITVVF